MAVSKILTCSAVYCLPPALTSALSTSIRSYNVQSTLTHLPGLSTLKIPIRHIRNLLSITPHLAHCSSLSSSSDSTLLLDNNNSSLYMAILRIRTQHTPRRQYPNLHTHPREMVHSQVLQLLHIPDILVTGFLFHNLSVAYIYLRKICAKARIENQSSA